MPRRWRADDEYQIIHDLLEQQRGHGAALASTQVPQAYKDTLTVASTPQTTMQLTYVPLANSIDLKWNGQGTIEGVDYSVDYTTGIVTFLSPLQTLLRATPAPADVLEAEYWTTGDLIAFSTTPDTGGITPGGVGRFSTNGTPVLTAPVTLDHATSAGDVCVVIIYTTSGNFPTAVTGLGATWTLGAGAGFNWAVGVGCTAGQTAITVDYGGTFTRDGTILAASFHGAGTRQFTSTGSDSSTPATVDVLKFDSGLILNHVGGGTGVPSAGQGAVIGWSIQGGSVGTATSSFTDTNGTYTQVGTPASGNGVTVEMGYAAIPASGGTDHVGHRSDSPTSYNGVVIVFDPA